MTGKTCIAFSAAVLASLSACGSAPLAGAEGQSIDISDHARLVLSVEGAQATGHRSLDTGISQAKEGEPYHRILRGGDDKVLFAYDLQVTGSPTGETYTFLLQPAATGPTFSTSRKVTAALNGGIRIELMDQPATGRQIVDVFKVLPREDHQQSFGAHLMALHNRFFHWVHGE
jgi:hypothetical protein